MCCAARTVRTRRSPTIPAAIGIAPNAKVPPRGSGSPSAHHLRNRLGLAEMIDLGCKVQPPQRHAQQELHPGHDAVAIADADSALGQVQLEAADIIRRCRIRRALEKCSEPLAAIDVASLRVRTELAGVHVLDHPLAQRADGIRTHGQLLSWMRFTTPQSSRQVASPAIDDRYPSRRPRR